MCQACYLNLEQLRELVYLDCANCKVIKSLPEDLPNLKILSIYRTNIVSIPSYLGLEALYCFHSSLAALPDMPKLRKLVAHGCNIDVLRDDLFRLETADISDTKVSVIPNTLVNLSRLCADNTPITVFPKKLISLEWLSIENTQISEMPNEMPSLIFLNCSDTNITDINEDECPMLRKLICRNCPINPFEFNGAINVST